MQFCISYSVQYFLNLYVCNFKPAKYTLFANIHWFRNILIIRG
jgi:hypothetical protein